MSKDYRADGGLNIVMMHTDIRCGSKAMPDKSSLEVTDAEASAVQKTPHRVTLDSIEEKIEYVDFINPERHPHMTICLVTLENGFVVLGSSAPADPGNFDKALGQKFSRENAIRQIWALEGYLLCERLSL